MGRACSKTGSRVATIKLHGLHIASIGREAFEQIVDRPVFDDHQGPPGPTAATWGSLLGAAGLPRHKRRQRVRFGAGLAERAAAALREIGYIVRGGDQRRQCTGLWTKAQPSPAWPEPLRGAHGRPRSLVILPAWAERIGVIAELCKIEPESHMLLVVKNQDEAKMAAGMLAKATSRAAKWRPEQPYGWPWLLVKSACSLSGCAPMAGEFVVFLNAELALSKTSLEFLMAAQESPRIGFLMRDERQLHGEERAALEALFGRVIYRPADAVPGADVTVAWLPYRGQSKRLANVVDQKRARIWKNDARNRLIARAARSLYAGIPVGLEHLGLVEMATWLNTANADATPAVAIIAANVEHGQELARLLTGWPLEAAGFTPAAGRIVAQDRVIVTLSRAAESLLDATAVIYAAAGRDWWLEQAYGLDCPGFGPNAILVVDVADLDSPLESASRAAGYRSLGLRQVTAVPATRPDPGHDGRRCR